MNRRSLIKSLSVAGVAVALPVSAPTGDVELIRLGVLFEAAWATEREHDATDIGR